jgi:hypothetical protein
LKPPSRCWPQVRTLFNAEGLFRSLQGGISNFGSGRRCI